MGEDILKEKALLVGWCESSSYRWKVLERLEELEQLAKTAGADVFEKGACTTEEMTDAVIARL